MKKKKGHKIILVILFIIILAAVVIGVVLWKKKVAAKEADTSVQILVEDGQKLVYGQITEICGNDMTYTTLEAIPNEQTNGENESSDETSNGERPSGEIPSGDMPNSEIPSGDVPDLGNSGFPFAGGSNTGKDGIIIDGVSFQATEDEVTVQIPVGTPVITKLGAETTFSRLAASDILEIVYDGENIVRVYIVG